MVNDVDMSGIVKSFESAVYCLLGSSEIFVGETKKGLVSLCPICPRKCDMGF